MQVNIKWFLKPTEKKKKGRSIAMPNTSRIETYKWYVKDLFFKLVKDKMLAIETKMSAMLAEKKKNNPQQKAGLKDYYYRLIASFAFYFFHTIHLLPQYKITALFSITI